MEITIHRLDINWFSLTFQHLHRLLKTVSVSQHMPVQHCGFCLDVLVKLIEVHAPPELKMLGEDLNVVFIERRHLQYDLFVDRQTHR